MAIIQFLALSAGLYLLFYSIFWWLLIVIANRSRPVPRGYINEYNPEILVILPAYKPGPVFFKVLDNVESASRGRDIQVFVLLQDADEEYREYAQQKGYYVEEKSFQHLGGNSYQHALHYISDVIVREQRADRWHPEFIMLVDKDNLLSIDFFNNIPEMVYDKYDVIQGKRASLNVGSSVAFFDTMSEMLNDSMFRIAKEKVGATIEISGSGALIETDLFLDAIHNLDPRAPGFDKNFMVQILTLERDVRTTFWPSSELREEKTNDITSHNPQRLRWFGEQYYNALFHAGSLWRAFASYRRFAALDYLITLWRPPRSIQFLITPALAACEIGWFFYTRQWIAVYPIFTVASIFLVTAVWMFVRAKGVTRKAVRYSLMLPVLAFHNLFNAIRSIRKENRGKFIHTSHRL